MPEPVAEPAGRNAVASVYLDAVLYERLKQYVDRRQVPVSAAAGVFIETGLDGEDRRETLLRKVTPPPEGTG